MKAKVLEQGVRVQALLLVEPWLNKEEERKEADRNNDQYSFEAYVM